MMKMRVSRGQRHGLPRHRFSFPELCDVINFWPLFFVQLLVEKDDRGNQSIYLHRSGPLLENGLDRPKSRYGRYGFPSFYSISISTVGVERARICLWWFSFLALWVVVVDISHFPGWHHVMDASCWVMETQTKEKFLLVHHNRGEL